MTALLDEHGITALPEDDRQSRHARLRPAAAALGLLRGAPRGRRGGARAGAPPARPPHRRLVEGGARPARLHRLQPERAAQDDLRRLVGARAAGRAGLDAVRWDELDDDRAGRADHRDRARALAQRRATRGRTSTGTAVARAAARTCTSATARTGCSTRRGRRSTRSSPTSRRASRPAAHAGRFSGARAPGSPWPHEGGGHGVPGRVRAPALAQAAPHDDDRPGRGDRRRAVRRQRRGDEPDRPGGGRLPTLLRRRRWSCWSCACSARWRSAKPAVGSFIEYCRAALGPLGRVHRRLAVLVLLGDRARRRGDGRARRSCSAGCRRARRG